MKHTFPPPRCDEVLWESFCEAQDLTASTGPKAGESAALASDRWEAGSAMANEGAVSGLLGKELFLLSFTQKKQDRKHFLNKKISLKWAGR